MLAGGDSHRLRGMADESTQGDVHADPLVVYATKGFDNYTFALDIETRERLLEETEGQVMPTSRVTVALDTKENFESAFGPIEPQVITLLTGFSHDHLRSRWELEVRDSKTDRVLWKAPPRAA